MRIKWISSPSFLLFPFIYPLPFPSIPVPLLSSLYALPFPLLSSPLSTVFLSFSSPPSSFPFPLHRLPFLFLSTVFLSFSSPQGYYSSSNSTAPLGRCNPGYYCPAKSTTPDEVPCPPRFYRPELGAGSVSDCSLCVAGGYCPEASIYPTICPKGYFCVGGISIPEPCLPGSYGNTTGLRYWLITVIMITIYENLFIFFCHVLLCWPPHTADN